MTQNEADGNGRSHPRANHVVFPLLLCLSACSGAPSAPTPAAARVPTGLPIVLSGQSNAVNLRSSLAAAYTPGVISVSESNIRIREWAPTGPLWQQLEPELHRKLTAFVWWQGETDGFDAADAAAYGGKLADLLARVRAANGDPHLLVVVVRILAYSPPGFDVVRQQIADVVARDRDAVLVSVDDLPGDGQAHLVYPEGYPPAAQRIVAAITAKQ